MVQFNKFVSKTLISIRQQTALYNNKKSVLTYTNVLVYSYHIVMPSIKKPLTTPTQRFG